MRTDLGGYPAAPGSPDEGVAWHYGDPFAEQRRLADGEASVNLSHRGVLTVSGADRLTWLHDLTTQHVSELIPGASSTALILSPHGHVEHELHLVDDGTTVWITCEPGTVGVLVDYLNSMRFMRRVEVADVSEDFGVIWEPTRSTDPQHPTWLIAPDFAGVGVTDAGVAPGGDASRYVPNRPAHLVGREVIVPRAEIASRLGEDPAGVWALEALRVAACVPRMAHETDHRTIPHEVGWIGPAVHLAKGCYRGQETVARVHNLGQPPRRLVLLHVDGSDNRLPAHGDPVLLGDREIGWIATAVQHHELGPIATAVIKRTVPVDAALIVRTAEGDVAAAQEPITTTQRP